MSSRDPFETAVPAVDPFEAAVPEAAPAPARPRTTLPPWPQEAPQLSEVLTQETPAPVTERISHRDPRVRSGEQDPFDLYVPGSAGDLGPADVGLWDGLKSAGTSILAGANRTFASTLYVLGSAEIAEEDYRAWADLAPEERKKQAMKRGFDNTVQRSVDFSSKMVQALTNPTSLVLERFFEDPINKADLISKTGELAGKAALDFSSRIHQLEQENVIPGFWTQTLPDAVGMTGAIAAASAAAGVATGGAIPPWLVAGYLGSSVGSEEAIEDAIQSGATQEQATIMAGVGALLGSTEAIPVTRVLDRVDTATGGVISKHLNRVLRKKLVGSVLKEGLKGAFEEGLQEAFQTVGQDAVAKYLYDPNRPVFGGLAEATTAGGGTGFILSGISAALGIPLRHKQQIAERRRIMSDTVLRATGMPLDPQQEDAIRRDAPFTPLKPEYFAMRQAINEILPRMEALTEMSLEDRTSTLSELQERFAEISNNHKAQVGSDYLHGRLPQERLERNLHEFSVNFNIEKGLPQPDKIDLKSIKLHDELWAVGEEGTWFFHLNTDDVEADQSIGLVTPTIVNTYFAEVVDQAPDAKGRTMPLGSFPSIEEAQLAIEAHYEFQEGLPRPLSVMEALEKQPVVVAGFNYFNSSLEYYRKVQEVDSADPNIPEGNKRNLDRHIEELEKNAALETSLAKELKNLLADLRGQYLDPDTKIVLSDGQFSGTEKSELGAMYSTDDGKLVQIGVNLQGLVAQLQDGELVNEQNLRGVARETLLHEFGHTVVNQIFDSIVTRVEATVMTNAEILEKINKPRQNSHVKRHYENVLKVREAAKAAGKEAASQKDLVLHKAIITEYARWLEDRLRNPFITRFRTVSPPSTIHHFETEEKGGKEKYGSGYTLPSVGQDLAYFYNFDEFMAENFARIGGQYEFVTKEAKGFFEAQREMIEKFYNESSNLEGMPAATEWVRMMSLEGQVEKLVKQQAAQQLTRYDYMLDPEKAKENGLDPAMFRDFHENNDRWQRFYKYGLSILQVAEINPHIEPLQRYVRTLYSYNNAINRVRWQGHNTLKQWRKIGKKQAVLLSELLYEETLRERAFTDEELLQRGLSTDAVQVLRQIKKDFANILDRMENVVLTEIRKNFAHDTVEMNSEINKTREEFRKMRSKPFFPLMRFGRHTVKVYAQETTEEHNKGALIGFYTFATRRERSRAMADIRAEHGVGDEAIKQGYLTDTERAVMGTPGPLLRELRTRLQNSDLLGPETQEVIDEMLKESLPLNSFKKHFNKRKKIAGWHEDGMRSYADYMMQAATNMARVEYQQELQSAVSDIAKDARLMKEGTNRAQIGEMASHHLKYLLNPSNDWPALRSTGFVMFLGFNIKSAFVNSTQLFLATYPYLAARHGDLRTTKAMGKSMRTLTKYWAGKHDSLPKHTIELIAKGMKEGWIDESLATELAIAKSSSGLDSSLAVTNPKRLAGKFAELSALPFHTVEKMNRIITAVAAHDLAMQDGLTHQQAAEVAREAVNATQFEYARFARPRFMQGKVGSNVFLFKFYLQSMLFRAFGDHPESSRIIFMMLVMAGLQGLPFAEDILDLLDAAGTKMKRALGWSNPKVQSRTMMREVLHEMQMNPEVFLQGLSRDSLGLGYIGDMTGTPIPSLDLHGSLSLGNIIPGTQSLKRLQAGEPGMAFLEFFEELAGAEASFMADIAAALTQDNPDTWKKWEKSLPSFLRQASRAGRYKQREGEYTARGEPIAEFDDTSMIDQLEIAAQALGFTPTRVSQGWERYIAERDVVSYYNHWRTSLLRNHNYARLYEDGETINNAMQEIRDYNKEVPYPEMRIGGDTLRRSLESFARTRAEAGQGVPQQRQFNRLSREIREIYSE